MGKGFDHMSPHHWNRITNSYSSYESNQVIYDEMLGSAPWKCKWSFVHMPVLKVSIKLLACTRCSPIYHHHHHREGSLPIDMPTSYLWETNTSLSMTDKPLLTPLAEFQRGNEKENTELSQLGNVNWDLPDFEIAFLTVGFGEGCEDSMGCVRTRLRLWATFIN